MLLQNPSLNQLLTWNLEKLETIEQFSIQVFLQLFFVYHIAFMKVAFRLLF